MVDTNNNLYFREKFALYSQIRYCLAKICLVIEPRAIIKSLSVPSRGQCKFFSIDTSYSVWWRIGTIIGTHHINYMCIDKKKVFFTLILSIKQ